MPSPTSLLFVSLASFLPVQASFDLWARVVVEPGFPALQQSVFTNYQSPADCNCLLEVVAHSVNGPSDGVDAGTGTAFDGVTNYADGIVDTYTVRNADGSFGSGEQTFEYWNVIYIEGTGGGSYAMFADNWEFNQYRVPVGGCRAFSREEKVASYRDCFVGTPSTHYRLLECEGDVNFNPAAGSRC